MRDNSSLTLVKDSHIWLKHSKMLYSGIYCLFLFIRTISFQKQAPTKVFPIVVTLAFARLSRHFESSCWHASATAPYNRSAIYTSYIYGANAVAPMNFLTSLSDRKKSNTTVCFLSRRKHWRLIVDFFSQSLVTSHPTEGITHAGLSKLVPWNLRWKSTAKGSCCGYLPPALTDFLYAEWICRIPAHFWTCIYR